MKHILACLTMVSILFMTISCGETTTPTSRASARYSQLPEEEPDPYFNRPFITVDETLEFFYGMSQSRVQTLCGKPLYVALGSADRIVWIYEVRELWVGEGVGNYQLTKIGSVSEIKSPLHYIGLAFESGSLVAWAPVTPGAIFNHLIYGNHLEVTESTVIEE